MKFYFIHNLIPFVLQSFSFSLFFVIYVDGPVYEAYKEFIEPAIR